jgi:hypothetical protein
MYISTASVLPTHSIRLYGTIYSKQVAVGMASSGPSTLFRHLYRDAMDLATFWAGYGGLLDLCCEVVPRPWERKRCVLAAKF